MKKEFNQYMSSMLTMFLLIIQYASPEKEQALLTIAEGSGGMKIF
uniref:Uncharacterized protein n=1 Tax=Candidatus Methanophaga sp. ANME-1 ERB7 TaxID=2759913 RepID=A0A7G9Z6C3_9EURY|nr:hypothetical protein LEBEIBBM_00022 [Methanosarcinales archaeon ANME-1 ERB7]